MSSVASQRGVENKAQSPFAVRCAMFELPCTQFLGNNYIISYFIHSTPGSRNVPIIHWPLTPTTTMSPYVPSIHLSDASYNQNMNDIQRRVAELAERRVRMAMEDADSDVDYHDDRGIRGRRGYDYREKDWRARRDIPEAVFSRWEQDDLEIAHMEKRVVEADRALEEALRDLKETKMRIRDRRREERQLLNERGRASQSVPEFAHPNMYETVGALLSGHITGHTDRFFDKASQQVIRDYLSPAGNKSRPLTPQPSSSTLPKASQQQPIRDYLSPGGNKSRPSTPQTSSSSLPPRSRSPSPYRFTSRGESEIPILPSSSVLEPRSRPGTPPAVHEGEGEEAAASQEQVYQSFNKIHDVDKEFQTLKQNFMYPSVIDFQKPGSQVGEIITVQARSPDESMVFSGAVEIEEGKLAYTRTNEALHTYSHAMEKLLGKLDCVDSWNETSVRSKRRKIIGEIEQEASQLERYRQKVWRDYCTLNI